MSSSLKITAAGWLLMSIGHTVRRTTYAAIGFGLLITRGLDLAFRERLAEQCKVPGTARSVHYLCQSRLVSRQRVLCPKLCEAQL